MRLTVMVLAVTTIVALLAAMRRKRGYVPIFFAELTVALNCLAFAAAAQFRLVDPLTLNAWSYAIRLHALLLILVGAILMGAHKA
jgi:hypothetical protein